MKIRRLQDQQLNARMQKQFEHRLVTHLRTAFPAQTSVVTDEVLTRFIHWQMSRAAGHGVVSEWDLQRYTEFAMMYGPEFDSDPNCAWAGKILATEGATGTQKMDWMDAHDQFVLNRPGVER